MCKCASTLLFPLNGDDLVRWKLLKADGEIFGNSSSTSCSSFSWCGEGWLCEGAWDSEEVEGGCKVGGRKEGSAKISDKLVDLLSDLVPKINWKGERESLREPIDCKGAASAVVDRCPFEWIDCLFRKAIFSASAREIEFGEETEGWFFLRVAAGDGGSLGEVDGGEDKREGGEDMGDTSKEGEVVGEKDEEGDGEREGGEDSCTW
jgi:hypothetical protein